MKNRIVSIILIFTTCAAGAVDDTTRIDSISSRKAVIYSMALPGLGQLYLKKPMKSVFFVSAEVFFIAKAVEYNRIYGYVEKTIDRVGYDRWINMTEEEKRDSIESVTGYVLRMNSWRPREKRNKYIWWSIGVYLFNILDAYVTAELYYFPEDIDVSMGYLPERGVSISLRYKF